MCNLEFKLWMEQQLQNANQLQTIPPQFSRLTHFTNDRIANMLLGGQNLNYGAQGIITTTADIHSNNEQVWKTIISGQYGAFNRTTFGNQVVFIDLTPYEVKMHRIPGMAPGFVENRKIAGILDRNTMTYKSNVNYRPRGNQKPQNIDQARRRYNTQPVNVPSPSQGGPDVW
ncbi:MAG: hypothetical protein DWQ19_11715 [Crenarchaeota archaeon]|nr:MAG: hypothetical protein DWQ19_11715 [Thermoproteota archaeon]